MTLPPARLAWAEARIVGRDAVTGIVGRFAVGRDRPHRAGPSVELGLPAPDGTARLLGRVPALTITA